MRGLFHFRATPVGAPAPGANGRARCIGLPSLRTEAVLLPLNAPPHHVGASAPGANGAGSVYWFAFASHRGGAPTIERATPPRRSTRPGCERTGPGDSFDSARSEGVVRHVEGSPPTL